VPIILNEPAIGAVRRLLEADDSMIVWWAARIRGLAVLRGY
jgi:hypothetical protein